MSVLYKYKCRIPTVQLSYTNGISVLYHRYMMLFSFINDCIIPLRSAAYRLE